MTRIKPKQLVFLGTSGAIPAPLRDNTGFLLHLNTKKILIDCPHQTSKVLVTLNVSIHSITHLFITHAHPDHVAGLMQLVHISNLINRKAPLEILASKKTINTCKKLIRDQSQTFEIRWISVRDGDDMQLTNDVKLYFIRVQHASGSLGLRIETPKTIITFSGDTEPCETLLRGARGADILINECSNASFTHVPGHSNPEEAGRIAQQAGVKQLYLVHLAPEFSQNSAVAISRARRTFSGVIEIPDDLTALEFC